jgi:HK97 gp10 family phage protein
MTFALKLQGGAELAAKLETLPTRVANKVIRQSLRIGTKIILAETVAKAPVNTGLLKKTLKVRAMKRRRNQIGVQVITEGGFYQGKAFYGAFLEFGHKAGPRKLGNKRQQVPAKPFIKPAFDAVKEQAASVILQAMKQGIEREAQS